jgi:hypothetical protein
MLLLLLLQVWLLLLLLLLQLRLAGALKSCPRTPVVGRLVCRDCCLPH